MRSNLGIHVANARFRNMSDFFAIPWTSFFVLHLNRDQVPQLRAKYPDSQIIVRAYTNNWHDQDPVAWAESIAQWANELKPYGIELTFANEQNLQAEGHPQGAGGAILYPPKQLYVDVLNWNLAVIRKLRELVPWARLHFPALSQGHSDDQDDAGYIGFEILRPAVEACDVLDVHTYWNPGQSVNDLYFGRRYEKVRALFPKMAMFVSECGAYPADDPHVPSEYVQWLNNLPQYVEGATFFIWDSDAANAIWTIADKPNIVANFKSYQPPQVQPSPTGWCQFATRVPTTKFWSGNEGRRGVVMHIAQGGYDAAVRWLSDENANPNSSAHFVIAKDGRIAQLVSIDDSAWANGLRWDAESNQWFTPSGRPVKPTWQDIEPGVNPNLFTISIEHEGVYQEEWTPEMYKANNRLLQWIAAQVSVQKPENAFWAYVPHRTLIGHYEIDPADRPNCPGPNVHYENMAADANDTLLARVKRLNDTLHVYGRTNLVSLPEGKVIRELADTDIQVYGYLDYEGKRWFITPYSFSNSLQNFFDAVSTISPFLKQVVERAQTVRVHGTTDLKRLPDGQVMSILKDTDIAVHGYLDYNGTRYLIPQTAWDHRMAYFFLESATQVLTPDAAALEAAKKITWMPVNSDAALYIYAQKNGLGCPQSDEFSFSVANDDYVGQVYNLGVVYAKKGDWTNLKFVKKPTGMAIGLYPIVPGR